MATMVLRFGPGVSGVEDLGARDFWDLLGEGEPLAGEARAELRSNERGALLLRLPLPETPDACGPRTEGPRGGATGYADLRRWTRAAAAEALAARLTHPRSRSLAEREWNLLCRLRAAGVATPEPLAVGSVGRGPFAVRSFLVTRALEDFAPLDAWLATHHSPAQRAELARAVGLALRRAFDAGVWLPRLRAGQLLAGPPSGLASPKVAGLASSPALEVAVADLSGARLLARIEPRRRARLLARLCAELRPDPRVGWRAVRVSLGRSPSRALRRACWRILAREARPSAAP